MVTIERLTAAQLQKVLLDSVLIRPAGCRTEVCSGTRTPRVRRCRIASLFALPHRAWMVNPVAFQGPSTIHRHPTHPIASPIQSSLPSEFP